jgi:hypothetical protein
MKMLLTVLIVYVACAASTAGRSERTSDDLAASVPIGGLALDRYWPAFAAFGRQLSAVTGTGATP